MDLEVTFRSEQRLTQAEFCEWLGRRPDDDHHCYELIHGRIVMTAPAGFGHGRLDAWLSHKLLEHVDERDLGVVLGSSTTYELPSGDTLEPDVSFISKERLAAHPEQDPERFSRIVPDLVIEILSPSTARRDRTVKKDIYAVHGVREYWLVDGRKRAVTIFYGSDAGSDAGRAIIAGPLPSRVLPELGLTLDGVFR